MRKCMLCEGGEGFFLCEKCMAQVANLDARRYFWYQTALKGTLFYPSHTSAASLAKQASQP